MTQASVDLLQEGLTKGQVRELLGPPLGQSAFNPSHWEYIFYSSNTELHTDSARHLIINFDEDAMLKDWQASAPSIELKKDESWLGLDWF